MLYRPVGTLLALLQISMVAYGAEEKAPPTATDETRIFIEVNTENGLISATPGMTRQGLLRNITALQSKLQKRQVRLERMEKEQKFKVADGIITALMPGGIIYAAVKKQRHHQVAERLKTVTSELEHLEEELLAYRSLHSQPDMLAAAH